MFSEAYVNFDWVYYIIIGAIELSYQMTVFGNCKNKTLETYSINSRTPPILC